jgi:DNA polymerase III subunit alpha
MSVHLYTLSHFSLLQGMMPIEQLVTTAKKRGFSAIALTDLVTMYGIPEFVKQCKKHDIKPLLGCVIDFEYEQHIIPVVLIAKNQIGYQQLIYQSTLANQSKKPVKLTSNKDSYDQMVTIVISEGGWLEGDLIQNDQQALFEKLDVIKAVFDDVYIGLSTNESPFWRQLNQWAKPLIALKGLRTVAIPKVYYADEEDHEAFRIVCGIRSGLTIKDKSLIHQPNRHLLDSNEMVQLYDIDDLITSDEIASKCEHIDINNMTSLPQFPLPAHVNSKQYLTQLCLFGLKKRFNGEVPDGYHARLKYELDVITSMNYEDYFLIVWDLIRFSKTQGIYVGPGRGSSAGSLVAFVLGITHVDPIVYDLLFERFLNPQRISMPDIDIDFPDNRRDEVIRYVKEKYGEDHIAQIVTFGTLAAKQCLRDVSRVYEIPLRDVDMLSKAVPNAVKITLQDAYDQSERFRTALSSDVALQRVFDMAKRLEGLPRHVSTHAAGIVMSKKPLQQVVPLISVEEELYSSQYSMEYLEDIGLIKMDLLGLRNLTIIDEIVNRMDDSLDILKIPLDDEKTYKLISNGDTVGVFQLESEGMKALIRKMRPDRFDDIVATIALFRPGPMENIPLYLKMKSDPSAIRYLLPQLEPILKSTYGIMIYQEQIMLVTQKIAGFSLAKADILRKAVSKKKEDEILALKQDFVSGCVNNGVNENVAITLFDLILKFANYGFNKSHSVAYALISYQMAYLKANYPLLFYTSLLTSVIGGESKSSEYLDECRQRGVLVLPPSVNSSKDKYVIEGKAIRFPIIAVKGIGQAAYTMLQNERNERGIFTDYYDFVARMLVHKFQTKWIETLIYAGALDEFRLSRATMIASLDDAVSYADLVRIEISGQSRIDLQLVSRPIPIVVKDQPLIRSEKEKEVLGFYLGEHPLLSVRANSKISYPHISKLTGKVGDVTFIAMIQRVKTHRTKKGDMMAFVGVSDESSFMDCVCLPNVYQKVWELLQKGAIVEISGKMEENGSCLVRNILQKSHEH